MPENARLYYVPIWHHSSENGGGPFGIILNRDLDLMRISDALLHPYFAELLVDSREWGPRDEMFLFQDSYHEGSKETFRRIHEERKTPNLEALAELRRRGGILMPTEDEKTWKTWADRSRRYGTESKSAKKWLDERDEEAAALVSDALYSPYTWGVMFMGSRHDVPEKLARVERRPLSGGIDAVVPKVSRKYWGLFKEILESKFPDKAGEISYPAGLFAKYPSE